MPTDMHPVAARRILRLAFGTALALFISQTAGWGLSFIAPVLVSVVLALPLPAPGIRKGLGFVVALSIPVWLTTWLILPELTYQPIVGLLLLVAACFWSFYYSAKGGSPVLGAFLTMGLAIVTAVGSVSVGAVIEINKALMLNAAAGMALVMLAYALFPDLPAEAGAPSRPPETQYPDREAAVRSAWRSTAIVLPVIVFFLFSSTSASYLAVMIKVASMGQQAENDRTVDAGKSLLMSTLIGGIGAIVMWNLMSIWPSLILYTLLVALGGLVMGRRVFQGQGMAPGAGTWSYAYLTMLVIIAPAVTDGLVGDAAGAKFFDRLVMMGFATLYGVVAVYVFDAFWRGRGNDVKTIVE